MYSEVDAIKERYRIEREQIETTTKDEEERRERLSLSKAQERLEILDKAFQSSKNWDQTKADMTGNSQQYQLNQTRTDRRAQSLNLANTQVAALDIQAKDPNANMVALNAQREQIMKEHFERLKLIESTYQNDSMSLQLGYGANVTGALAGMFRNMLGESSSAYHILYESQRAFALAQAGMNMWKAASDAYANEPGTWYQKRQLQRLRLLNQERLYLLSRLQRRKVLQMVVIQVTALNTLQQGLCIKVRLFGRKKISNAGAV